LISIHQRNALFSLQFRTRRGLCRRSGFHKHLSRQATFYASLATYFHPRAAARKRPSA